MDGVSWNRAAREEALLAFGDLHGLPIKLAQLLHETPELVPPALRPRLAAAYASAPPMASGDARAVLERALRGRVEHLFESIDLKTPLAVASIGQVHTARVDAREVVVKIQFPDLVRDIEADLSLLRAMVCASRWSEVASGVVAELGTRVLEECDYRREADALTWFAPPLASLGVRVPEPIVELSTREVLTMTRLPGRSFDAHLGARPSAARRDASSLALLRAWVFMIGRLRRYHADPSRGNVRFADDGALLLLDFGSTRAISEPLAARVVALILDADAAESPETARLFEALGVLAPGDERAFRELVVPLAAWFGGPRAGDALDFRRGAWAPRGRERLRRILDARGRLGVHPEFVLLFRTMHGLYRLLDELGARIPLAALHFDEASR